MRKCSCVTLTTWGAQSWFTGLFGSQRILVRVLIFTKCLTLTTNYYLYDYYSQKNVPWKSRKNTKKESGSSASQLREWFHSFQATLLGWTDPGIELIDSAIYWPVQVVVKVVLNNSVTNFWQTEDRIMFADNLHYCDAIVHCVSERLWHSMPTFKV